MGMDGLALTPGALTEMISLIDEGVISGKIAKDVLPRLLEGEGNSGVRAFVEAQGLVQISGGCGTVCVCVKGGIWHNLRASASDTGSSCVERRAEALHQRHPVV
jgi:hypothetical protein